MNDIKSFCIIVVAIIVASCSSVMRQEDITIRYSADFSADIDSIVIQQYNPIKITRVFPNKVILKQTAEFVYIPRYEYELVIDDVENIQCGSGASVVDIMGYHQLKDDSTVSILDMRGDQSRYVVLYFNNPKSLQAIFPTAKRQPSSPVKPLAQLDPDFTKVASKMAAGLTVAYEIPYIYGIYLEHQGSELQNKVDSIKVQNIIDRSISIYQKMTLNYVKFGGYSNWLDVDINGRILEKCNNWVNLVDSSLIYLSNPKTHQEIIFFCSSAAAAEELTGQISRRIKKPVPPNNPLDPDFAIVVQKIAQKKITALTLMEEEAKKRSKNILDGYLKYDGLAMETMIDSIKIWDQKTRLAQIFSIAELTNLSFHYFQGLFYTRINHDIVYLENKLYQDNAKIYLPSDDPHSQNIIIFCKTKDDASNLLNSIRGKE